MNVFKSTFFGVVALRTLWLFLACTLLTGNCVLAGAQETPPDDVPLAPRVAAPTEAYRLRVENMRDGSVSLSADSGAHYTLIGRVTHPASAVLMEKAANAPGAVLRGGNDGMAFAVNLGQTLKLRPTSSSAIRGKHGGWASPVPESCAILTNLAPRVGVFGDLLPPAGTQVKLESVTRALHPFPTLYEPSEDDVIVFLVPLQTETGSHAPGTEGKTQGTDAKAQEQNSMLNAQRATLNPLSARIAALGQAYLTQALARARQERRAIVSGTLNLKAKLPKNEPDPVAYIDYVIDNSIVSQSNVEPFTFDWNTRQVADGEHLVEVRALNRDRHVITSKRTLVVVQNKPN